MKTKVVKFLEDYGDYNCGEIVKCEMKLAGLLSEKGVIKIQKKETRRKYEI